MIERSFLGCLRELMCTVSFIPNSQGFYIGMNRDESVRRVTANAPEVSYRDGHALLYPAEPSGGTWIGVNDTGFSLALINWHAVSSLPKRPVVSRGTVVKTLIRLQSSNQLVPAIEGLPIRRMPPFRLIAILLLERAVHEFRWNQIEISEQRYEWEARHWFSSGFDETAVQEKRAKVCRTAWDQPQAGSLNWLRQLHASHSPAPGPFSVCMHHKDAATVCYTEIVSGNGTVVMKYHHGPLCNGSTDFVERIIPLRSSESLI
jgi:Transport and Golgi organisation 2